MSGIFPGYNQDYEESYSKCFQRENWNQNGDIEERFKKGYNPSKDRKDIVAKHIQMFKCVPVHYVRKTSKAQ